MISSKKVSTQAPTRLQRNEEKTKECNTCSFAKSSFAIIESTREQKKLIQVVCAEHAIHAHAEEDDGDDEA